MHEIGDHNDIDVLALPDRPPKDAPITVLLGYLVRRWWRSSRWHWTTVRDTGITVYQVNGRGERRVQQRPGGYQPIDRHWLVTGEWSRAGASRSAVHESGTRSMTPVRPFLPGVTAAEASRNLARAIGMCPSVRPPVSGSRRD